MTHATEPATSDTEGRCSVMTTFTTKLPDICAAAHPVDGSPIVIRRSESGYYPARAGFDIEGFNARHGITAKHVECMLVGSMFGWHVPGANLDYEGA